MIRMEESASADEENQTFSKKLKKYLKNLTDFSQYSAKTILYIIIFVVIIIASLILLYIIFFVDETFLYRFVIEFFVNPVYNLGILGILLFVLIMGVQGLVAPLPSEIVLLATGMIWGIFWGGLMGVIGSMAAALLCYYISRGGGRPLAEKFVGANAIKLADDFINKYGIGAIIIARFLPFIAFDPISYASGLVNMDVKKYSLGTLIGSFPRAFFFSWLGASLGLVPPIVIADLDLSIINTQSAFFNGVLVIVLAILFATFLLYYVLAKYHERKKTEINK
ncbi:hypothetical protein LCGC14_1555880 [marine sediment metagenome]|uniref:VTT domain-containing protein n=2 Tax=marine sediment metagenome TaxID=412755 RepID=A0A0F9INY0_9ZZZZ